MKRIVFIACAVSLFAACSQKGQIVADAPFSKVFVASTESSRTFTSGGNVYWNTGDAISVFDKNTSNAEFIYAGEAGATSGSFVAGASVEAQGSLPLVYASYPYDEYNVISSDGVMNLWFQNEQYYTQNSFGPGANVMVAASEDNNLAFKNACGYLNIQLYGDSSVPLLGIEVQGNNSEKISGEAFVTVDTSGGVSVQMDPEESFDYVVVYDPGASVILSSNASRATSFWVALPPTNFTRGINVTVASQDGRLFEFESSAPLEIKRGVCTTTASLEVTFPAASEISEDINENVAGYYNVQSDSYFDGWGPYSEILYISAAPEGAPGNVYIEGQLAELPVSFYAEYDPAYEAIFIPAGTIVYSGQVWQGDPTVYDVTIYIMSVDEEGVHYYSDDIPLVFTGDHQLEYYYEGSGYYIGFFDNDLYVVDLLTTISFNYVSSSGSSGYGQMSAPDFKERVRALAGKPVKVKPIKAGSGRRTSNVLLPFLHK